MKRLRLTASGIWRAMLCLGSAVLPHDRSTTEHMERGSAGHRFLQDARNLGRDAALAQVDDKYREALALLDTTQLPVDPDRYAAEVAMSFNVVTGGGRELHRKGDRDYSMCTPPEIPGTADVVALLDDDGVYVGDYKFGRSWLAGPDENWQFKALALMAARAFDRTRVVVEMIRVRDDGAPLRIRAEFDALDLAGFAEELRVLHANGSRAAASDMEVPVTAGPHCRGCEALRSCSRGTAMIRAVAGGELAINTQEQAVRAIQSLPIIRQALEKLEEELENYGRTYPFTLEDGSRFGPVDFSRSEPNGTAAFRMLERDYGAEVAWGAVELKSSWTALEDVARREAERRNKARVEGEKKTTIKSLQEGMRAELEQAEAAHVNQGGKRGTFVRSTTFSSVKLLPPPKPKALPKPRAA